MQLCLMHRGRHVNYLVMFNCCRLKALRVFMKQQLNQHKEGSVKLPCGQNAIILARCI